MCLNEQDNKYDDAGKPALKWIYGETTIMIRTRLFGTLSACLLGFAFLVSGSASASTVFAPSDGNINFFNISLSEGTLLAMFDDSDTSFAGSNLSIPMPEVVTITEGGIALGDYTAENEDTPTPATLNLTGSDWFILAISTDDGTSWSGDTNVIVRGTNSYDVYFSDERILQVDARVVPVPAAVWLFGSGLLGLVGVARRKAA